MIAIGSTAIRIVVALIWTRRETPDRRNNRDQAARNLCVKRLLFGEDGLSLIFDPPENRDGFLAPGCGRRPATAGSSAYACRERQKAPRPSGYLPAVLLAFLPFFVSFVFVVSSFIASQTYDSLEVACFL
jgi:hypothetical protein